ncbi:alpha/beta fold hydrolase [Streptomyces sp. S.PNR 29]|uniref:thioesterase II family protein n=1 Tax=Streptomyces sp. S.PNR 29 TaxID=2973805 RepID=UPI0025B1EA00|nr:alpha/beta fold hydrolase [Streptomyces sp. S.PNR 29]MDN0197927.1 alpha/beta fold hydrolase [Streptomyces sp. S.PNR 29]
MDGTGPALRLFVFHHAGGSHVPYRQWPALLPEQWEVRLLDAPGRGRLGDLPQLHNAARLADFFRRRLKDELQGPYAFFGHSMGAVIAYELTVQLAARGQALPVWLGLSARGAPRWQGEDKQHHHLPGTELQSHLELLGGTPDEVFDHPDLWALYEPLIRGDMRLVETWRPQPGTPVLPVALSVFGGSQDTSVPAQRLAGWERHTERFLGVRLFDGGHFYFLDDPRVLLGQVCQDVDTALALAADLPPAAG